MPNSICKPFSTYLGQNSAFCNISEITVKIFVKRNQPGRCIFFFSLKFQKIPDSVTLCFLLLKSKTKVANFLPLWQVRSKKSPLDNRREVNSFVSLASTVGYNKKSTWHLLYIACHLSFSFSHFYCFCDSHQNSPYVSHTFFLFLLRRYFIVQCNQELFSGN